MTPQRLELDRVRRALTARSPVSHRGLYDNPRRAAVALVLRPRRDDLDVLFIRRAERFDDPWSGHMAFPGGHLDPGDESLEAAARRETREELDLHLPPESLVGALDEYPARARGREIGMVVSPYVYAIEGDPPLRPNHEVAEAIWVPLGVIARGEVSTTRPYELSGQTLQLPAYRVGEHLVWGMTYGMLGSLLTILR